MSESQSTRWDDTFLCHERVRLIYVAGLNDAECQTLVVDLGIADITCR
jgi:hypothetical protein